MDRGRKGAAVRNRETLSSLLLMAGVMGAATGAVAQTAEWHRLGQDGPFEIAVDVGSFTGARTERAVRTLMVPLEERAGARYKIINVRIDCEGRTISAVSAMAYNAQGTLLGEGALEPDTSAVEESDISLRLARAVCDGVEIDGQAFDSTASFVNWAATRQIEP